MMELLFWGFRQMSAGQWQKGQSDHVLNTLCAGRGMSPLINQN